MGMTIAEKILAAKAGKKFVEPGELIIADVDLVLANDITAPIAIREFKNGGATKVWDRTKIALVPDHFTPNKDIKSAEQAKIPVVVLGRCRGRIDQPQQPSRLGRIKHRSDPQRYPLRIRRSGRIAFQTNDPPRQVDRVAEPSITGDKPGHDAILISHQVGVD